MELSNRWRHCILHSVHPSVCLTVWMSLGPVWLLTQERKVIESSDLEKMFYYYALTVCALTTCNSRCSAAHDDLLVPQTRRRLGNQAYCLADLAAWNNLPLDIRTASTLATFNRKLSCRRESARCIMSLNISLSYSRSLKVIRSDTLE